MNEEQKKRADELVSEWNTHYPEYVADRMAALLQELIDAPEVEPDYWSGGHYCEGSKPYISPLKVWKLPVGTKLYTAPPHQSEHHLEMVNTPAPSVPDGWRSFLTDVITSAGLLAHGKRDKGLASRIGKFAFDAMLSAQQPEPPADVARDAERYRWLLKQAWFQQAADRFDLPDGGLQNRFEKCMDEFIDAAMSEKGQS